MIIFGAGFNLDKKTNSYHKENTVHFEITKNELMQLYKDILYFNKCKVLC